MSENIQEIEKLIRLAQDVRGLEGGLPFIVLPDNCDTHSLEKFMGAPQRIKRHMHLETAGSFIRYFGKWKGDESEIYACRDSVDVRAILDEHVKTEEANKFVQPAWCDHTARYTCPFSREWLAWKEGDRRKVSQVEFAEFLEDRLQDVVDPPGGELMSLANQLQIIRKATFGSSQRLASGETSFSYSEENQTGTVEIPAMITLGIPVFKDGTNYKINARFKYRLTEGRLMLWYELIEPEKYVDDAFTEVLQLVNDSTGIEPTLVTQLP